MVDINSRRGSGDFLSNISSVSSSSQCKFLSVFYDKTRYPIINIVSGYLSISGIVSLTRTCKRLSGLYRYLIPIQWDVDKALRHYFDNPQCFRSQMAKSDALLVGHFALRYFKRTVCEPHRLDVVVQEDRAQLIYDFLSYEAGYEYIETSPAINEPVEVKILTFHKNAASKTPVYLYIKSCPPVEALLIETKTTVSVCFISWNKAYSVFALPTFVHHKSYLLQECDDITGECAQIESLEGWLVQGVMWPEDMGPNHPIQERRRIGDHYTWTIPLNTIGVESSRTPDNVVDYSCFSMDLSVSYSDYAGYDTQKEDVRNYKIIFHKIESKVLKHTYLCGNVIMKNFLMRRLHSFTLFELRMLEPAQRPPGYDQILRNRGNIDAALESFDRPASWTYRDDQIPTWYKFFERLYPERKIAQERAM